MGLIAWMHCICVHLIQQSASSDDDDDDDDDNDANIIAFYEWYSVDEKVVTKTHIVCTNVRTSAEAFRRPKCPGSSLARIDSVSVVELTSD
ncbi:hypothetical protein VTN77DRAFT_2942 [Rasamsonia byssochlamydoides]|uniref:uncharacterized protein n=1 Tax=Rasamsonia byssochlamydoides TaxID=89139 RepID=UPI0037425DBD